MEIRSADYPADTVIGQWPPAKVKAADVVLLVNRSERGATYVMPDVIGLDGTRAADLLRGWGFRASVVGTYPVPRHRPEHRAAPEPARRLPGRARRRHLARGQPMNPIHIAPSIIAADALAIGAAVDDHRGAAAPMRSTST